MTAEQAGKVKARYSEQDGTPVYRVRFTLEDTSYSYQIDAETGAVLERETGSAAEGHSRGRRGGRGSAAEAGRIAEHSAEESAA